MSPRVIACRMAANYSIQYSLYLLALVVCGLGLWSGAFSGGGPTALTLIPAILSAAALIIGAAMGLVPGDFERRLERMSRRSGRIGRLATRFAHAAGDARRGRTYGADAHSPAPLGSARGRGVLGVRHRVPGPVVPRVRRDRPGRRPRDGLLPRDARQPAATPRWHRRRRGRDDRCVRGLRRARRTRRWSPCSRTARSRSGCPRSRESGAMSRCGRPSAAGGSRTRRSAKA